MARYKGHTAALLEWLGTDRRKKPLESITALDARRWRESLQDAGRAGKTVLAYMKDAGAVYRSAIREGLVSFNPFSSLEAIDTSDSQERKSFTPDEVASLVEAATSEEWRGLVLVAAFTGLRLGDASKLSWQAVDLDAKKITLIPSKTKKKKREVQIPIHPDLLAYLMAAPVHEDSPAAPVFPSLAKKKIGDRAGLSQSFNKLMAAAGVDRGKPSRVIKEDDEKGVGRITGIVAD
jgi:integrase